MKHLKTYEQTNSPYTLFELRNKLYDFLSKLNNVLPYHENDYYTIKLPVGNSISITRIINKTKKQTVLYIPMFKDDNRNKKSTFGKNIYEKIFTIRIMPKAPDPYTDIIINYIIDNIKSNNVTIIDHGNRHLNNTYHDLIFDETHYNEVIDKINNLSIDDLEISMSANKFNL